jgi:peptidoglycan hydrolase-like protein with peptidoglycan-binding domain
MSEQDQETGQSGENCETEERAVNKTVTDSVVLGTGSVGNFTEDLQARLNALGFTDKNGNILDVDGDFGGLTRSAVKKLQEQYGLKPDGIVGKDTLAALELAEAQKALNELTLERAADTTPVPQADGTTCFITREQHAQQQVAEATAALENTGLKTLQNADALRHQARELASEITEDKWGAMLNNQPAHNAMDKLSAALNKFIP